MVVNGYEWWFASVTSSPTGYTVYDEGEYTIALWWYASIRIGFGIEHSDDLLDVSIAIFSHYEPHF